MIVIHMYRIAKKKPSCR